MLGDYPLKLHPEAGAVGGSDPYQAYEDSDINHKSRLMAELDERIYGSHDALETHGNEDFLSDAHNAQVMR